jgi:hypothetical protein
VCRPENWGSMQVGVTVYLEGTPDLLAKRVLTQDGGASRPLLSSSAASIPPSEDGTSERLAGILRQREASYRNADCVVSLQGSGTLGASAPQVRCRPL